MALAQEDFQIEQEQAADSGPTGQSREGLTELLCRGSSLGGWTAEVNIQSLDSKTNIIIKQRLIQ